MTLAVRETAEAVPAPGRLRRLAASPIALTLAGVVIFLGALALFRWGLDAAREVYFDETWYVPAARTLLKTGEMTRQEHPPLGKLLIAASMALFGDNPIGWRAMSAGFGAATLAAMFAWSLALTRDARQALWATAATLCDGVLYVQSRAAMLDIFLMAFGAMALALVTFSLKERHSPRRAHRPGDLERRLPWAGERLQAVGRVPVGRDRRHLRPDRPDAAVARALRGAGRARLLRFRRMAGDDARLGGDRLRRRAVRRLFPRLSAADDPRRNGGRVLRRAAADDRNHDRLFGDPPVFQPLVPVAGDDAPGVVPVPGDRRVDGDMERAAPGAGDRRPRQPVPVLSGRSRRCCTAPGCGSAGATSTA